MARPGRRIWSYLRTSPWASKNLWIGRKGRESKRVNRVPDFVFLSPQVLTTSSFQPHVLM